MHTTFSFADLCAGIGGFRVGLEKLGGKCIFSCDIDKDCEKTYKSNHGEGYDIHDIFEIDEVSFPKVDLLCAGFPCQPFSIAGKKTGFNDPRGTIFFKILTLAELSKPKIIFLENVPNLVNLDNGKIFKIMISELDRIGYDVHFDILDSSNFGVPQTRKRVYIVAISKNIPSFGFQFTRKRTPKIPFKSIINVGDSSIPISDKWETYIDLYTGKITLDEINFNVPKTRKCLERADQNVNLEDCIFQMRSSGIRALSIEKPLSTFAVSISGGGAMIPVYSKERRHLSLIEMKRLMGFHDEFIFPVSRTLAIKQLANSVCPPVIESIGKDFIPYLENNSNNLVFENLSLSQYV